MTFERTVKFDGYTSDDEREEAIFEIAFNPIRRVFEYQDLADEAVVLCGTVEVDGESIPAISLRAKKAKSDWREDAIGWMQGGLLPHVVLTNESVEKRYKMAKLLHTALSRDTDPLLYGSTNKRAIQALIETREYQIRYVVKAIDILSTALNEFQLVGA